jgi:hypothetical protein
MISVDEVLRESWLHVASVFLLEHMQQQGLPSVEVRVSCGWPASGGLGEKHVTIGQCFPPTMCKDGRPQIFISPRLADSVEVLATLLHELIHASVGCDAKHGKRFSQAARACGLAGPPTATTAGEALKSLLQGYVERAGVYPHAAIVPRKKAKKGSRLRLYQCSCEEPVKVRVASDTFQAQCLVCDELFVLVPKDE